MKFSSPSPVARALAKAGEVTAALEEASRRFEAASDYAELSEAEELASKAARLAAS